MVVPRIDTQPAVNNTQMTTRPVDTASQSMRLLGHNTLRQRCSSMAGISSVPGTPNIDHLVDLSADAWLIPSLQAGSELGDSGSTDRD